MAVLRYLALTLAVLGLVLAQGGCTGGSGTAVSLSLSVGEIAAGDTCRATATVTSEGQPVPGATVTFSVSPSAVASAITTTAVADANGRASATVRGLAAGWAVITASSSGAVSEGQRLTVLGPTVAEHVLFLGGPDSTYQVVPNAVSNTTPSAAPLGGVRWAMGTQRAGALALVIPQDVQADTGWVRNLHTGTETAFAYASFRPLIPLLGPRTAAITSSGDRVYWIQSVSGTTQLMRANADGSGAIVVYAPMVAASERPISVVLSPDDSTLAFVTASNRVYRMAPTDTGPTEMPLGSSSEPTAIWWLNDTTLLVAVRHRFTTELPAIIKLSTAGVAPLLVYDNGGTGMRSAPFTLTTDWQSNILFDEQSASGTNTDIYRLHAPGYTTEEPILARSEVDGYPTIVNY